MFLIIFPHMRGMENVTPWPENESRVWKAGIVFLVRLVTLCDFGLSIPSGCPALTFNMTTADDLTTREDFEHVSRYLCERFFRIKRILLNIHGNFFSFQPPKGRRPADILSQNSYIVNLLNISLPFPHLCVIC